MTVQLVMSRMDPVLEACGYTRKTMTWNRTTGSMIDVIDVQVSKTLDTVTINAGVLDTEIHALIWSKPAAPPFRTSDCTVVIRPGQLLDGRDKWWDLKPSETPQQMAEITQEVVLPFIDRMHSRAAMKQWLIDARVLKRHYPLPILHLALLKHFTGESVEACSILKDLSAGAWQDRAMDVRSKIGCDA